MTHRDPAPAGRDMIKAAGLGVGAARGTVLAGDLPPAARAAAAAAGAQR